MNEDKLKINYLEDKIVKLEKTIYRLKSELKMKELEKQDLIHRYRLQNDELVALKIELKGGNNED